MVQLNSAKKGKVQLTGNNTAESQNKCMKSVFQLHKTPERANSSRVTESTSVVAWKGGGKRVQEGRFTKGAGTLTHEYCHPPSSSVEILRIWSHLETEPLQMHGVKLRWVHIPTGRTPKPIWLVSYKKNSRWRDTHSEGRRCDDRECYL